MSTYPDEQWAELIRQSDDTAFRQLYEAHWKLLYRLAVQKTGSGVDAEDMVQELFAELWKKRTSLQLTNATSFKTYLVSCLYFKIFKYYRRKGFQEKHYEQFRALPDTAMDVAAMENEYGRMQEIIEQTILLMPGQMQRVMLLKYLRGLSTVEIGKELGIGPETVKSHLKAGTQRLRKTAAQYPHTSVLIPLFSFIWES